MTQASGVPVGTGGADLGNRCFLCLANLRTSRSIA
jgi:hypothetical protein